VTTDPRGITRNSLIATHYCNDDERVVSVHLGLLRTPNEATGWLVIGTDLFEDPVYLLELGSGESLASLEEATAHLETSLGRYGRVFHRVPVPKGWLGAWEDQSPLDAGPPQSHRGVSYVATPEVIFHAPSCSSGGYAESTLCGKPWPDAAGVGVGAWDDHDGLPEHQVYRCPACEAAVAVSDDDDAGES
jgi:hypothetical protein